MKKTSLIVALPAVALSGLLLTGCGLFHSHKAWSTAQQESPLEIPPGLDRPSTTEALSIPQPGANQPTSNGATASVGAANGQIADAFVLGDTVDNAYHRVGQVLESGSLGQLQGHDDAAHSYTVVVSDAATQQKKGGFMSSLFGHKVTGDSAAPPGAASHPVQISIVASGQTGSEIRVEGNPAAVAKVIDTLKSRLGG